MNQDFIFICADESVNAGERDYSFALLDEVDALKKQGHAITTHLFKIAAQNSSFIDTKQSLVVDPKNFRPRTNADYARMPSLPKNIADHLGIDVDRCVVMGIGHSTLNAVLDVQNDLERHDIRTDAAYVTHLVGSLDVEKKIAERGVTVFTPGVCVHDDVSVVSIPSVPHTNTLQSAQHHYDALNKAAHENQSDGNAMLKAHAWAEQGQHFAMVVINAGFKVGDTWVPYTLEEARAHGRALAASLPKGTNLCAMHGGPRNVKDKEVLGADPADSFMQGFLEAQGDDAGEAVLDTYDTAFDKWNAIKASYILAQKPSCKAFISNAEGYGTMDGAILAIDNSTILLGAFPFNALSQDPSGEREKNLRAYNAKGIALLSTDDTHTLVVARHPDAQRTPIAQKQSPAAIIIDHYVTKESGPSPAAQPRPFVS